MTTRRINLLMNAGAASMLLIGIITIIASALVPMGDVGTSLVAGTTQAIRVSSNSAGDLPSLEAFEPVFAANLRGARSTSDTVENAAGLTLVGTVGSEIALLKSGATVEARNIGEQFGNATLVAVRSGEADVRTADGIVTLRKAPDAPSPDFIKEAQP